MCVIVLSATVLGVTVSCITVLGVTMKKFAAFSKPARSTSSKFSARYVDLGDFSHHSLHYVLYVCS